MHSRSVSISLADDIESMFDIIFPIAAKILLQISIFLILESISDGDEIKLTLGAKSESNLNRVIISFITFINFKSVFISVGEPIETILAAIKKSKNYYLLQYFTDNYFDIQGIQQKD